MLNRNVLSVAINTEGKLLDLNAKMLDSMFLKLPTLSQRKGRSSLSLSTAEVTIKHIQRFPFSLVFVPLENSLQKEKKEWENVLYNSDRYFDSLMLADRMEIASSTCKRETAILFHYSIDFSQFFSTNCPDQNSLDTSRLCQTHCFGSNNIAKLSSSWSEGEGWRLWKRCWPWLFWVFLFH